LVHLELDPLINGSTNLKELKKFPSKELNPHL